MSLRLMGLEVDRKRFRLGPVDLTVPDATFLAILGESGAGKSTLLHAIAGLIEPSRGRIFVDDVDVSGLPAERRAITLCQQDSLLFPVYRVLDNLCFALVAQGMDRDAAREVARKRASKLRIPETLLSARVDKISGGEARRVALGRALLKQNFRIALLDEIVSNLDGENKRGIAKLILETFVESDTVFLFITHEPALALEMASAVISAGRGGLVAVMKEGRIIQTDTPERVYNAPISTYTARLFGDVTLLDPSKIDLSRWGAVSAARSQQVGVRPEDAVFFAMTPPDCFSIPARVLRTWFVGTATRVEVDTSFGSILATASADVIVERVSEGFLTFRKLLFLKSGEDM